MDPMTVPKDLTPEAAMIVYNWICQIEAEIFDHYHEVLVPIIIEENRLSEYLKFDECTSDSYDLSTDDPDYEDSVHGDEPSQAPGRLPLPLEPGHRSRD